jgi:hypothetical protein
MRMNSRVVLTASILLPFLHILFYAWNTATNIVLRDDIYLIKGAVVERFCEGALSFADLWRAAGGTRLLGYNLLLVANTAWFGLNSRGVVLLIPFVLLATALLIYRDYRSSLTGLRPTAWVAGMYLLPMLLLFNLTLWEGLSFAFSIIFVWSVPWYIASYYALEDLLETGRKLSWLCAGMISSLAFLVFGQTSSFAFAAALAITFGCRLIIDRHSIRLEMVFRAAAISVGIGLLIFLYLYRIGENDYFPGSVRLDWRLLADPWASASFVLSALAASVLGVDVSKTHFGPASIAGMGLIVFLIYAIALLLYFKAGMHKRTRLPLFMIAYSAAFVAFMTVGRFRYGIQYGMASRYVCNSILGVIAIVWIAIFVKSKGASTTKALRIALFAGVTFILMGMAWTSIVEWQIQPHRKGGFVRLQDIAMDVDNAFDDEFAAFEERPLLVRDSLLVLRKYRLNVYRTGVERNAIRRGRLPRPPSSMIVSYPASGAADASTASRSRTLLGGYATLDCDAGSVPYATAVLKSGQSDDVTSETVLPAVPPAKRFRVFVESGPLASGSLQGLFSNAVDIDTGIAIVNRCAQNAGVTYTFRSLSGVALAKGSGSLAPGSHLARFVGALRNGAPSFRLPDDFAAGAQIGSLEIAGDQPISVAALRQITNERGERLTSAAPTADLSQASINTPVYFPHFMDGGGYTTSLILLDTSEVRETGAVHVLDDSGRALPVKPIDGNPDSVFRYSIEPGGLFQFHTEGSPAVKTEGWMQVIPDTAVPAPVGTAVVRYRRRGVLVTESAVPSAPPTTHARIYLDMSVGHNTGMAVGNPAGSAASIAVKVFGTDGNASPTGSQGLVELQPYGHSARFADELIEGLPRGFRGLMDVSSQSPFIILALRSVLTARGDSLLSAFAPADLTREPPSPIVFPQIVDGDGHSTEFLLMGSGNAGTATIRFFGEMGLPLAVGR